MSFKNIYQVFRFISQCAASRIISIVYGQNPQNNKLCNLFNFIKFSRLGEEQGEGGVIFFSSSQEVFTGLGHKL